MGLRMRSLLSFFGWLYLARVSVVALAMLFALPLGAQGFLRTLAIGAFDLHLSWGAFFVGFTLVFAAWATFITAAVVFTYGAKRSRFDVEPVPDWMLPAWRYALGAVVLVNVWTIFAATDHEDHLRITGWVLVGLFAGMVLVSAFEEIHRQKSGTWLGGTLYLFPIRGERVTLGEVAVRLRLRTAPEQIPNAQTDGDPAKENGAKGIPSEWLSRGYLELAKDKTWRMMPGHTLLRRGAIVFFVLNVLIFNFSFESAEETTALFYLLILLTTGALISGVVSFFLDAYRLPFISVCIVVLFVMGRMRNADHYYRIWPRTVEEVTKKAEVAKQSEVLTPAQVLEKAVDAERPIVLVAIAGGGIQSAAWGTRVLTGLEELALEARKAEKFGSGFPDFAGSIQCISGVSGGSTGAMFFTAGYGEGGLPAPRPENGANPQADPGILPKIVAAAEETSLGQSVWGFTYPDLRRAWFPFFISNDYRDRAEKMELKWARNAIDPKAADKKGLLGRVLSTASLAGWQADVRKGMRPAIIFNGTIVETGERLSFSTAPIRRHYEGQREFVSAGKRVPEAERNKAADDREKGAKEGREVPGKMDDTWEEPEDGQLYPGADLRITTAARLSATFPLISSAARPLLAKGPGDEKGMIAPKGDLGRLIPGENALRHVVDGGYYENTGLGALAQWLDDGLTELVKTSRKWPRSILIIQLEAFPEPEPEPEPQDAPESQAAGQRGTLFQIGSPLVALYNVRGAGHTASATRLVQILQQRWQLAKVPDPKVPAVPARTCQIHLVRFTIPALPHDSTNRKFWQPAWADADPKKPPLSWHLRESEKEEIEISWKAFRHESKGLPYAGKEKSTFSPSEKRKDQHDPGAWPVDYVLTFLKEAQEEIQESKTPR